ncbi:hypothetical protein GCM10027194_12700 [Thalassiella azotivora]
MGTKSARSLPWSGDSAHGTLGFLAALLTALYALLVPLHLVTLPPGERVTMALVAGASVAVAGSVLWATHREHVPHRHVDGLTALVISLPLVNSLAHLTTTGEIEQTSVVMLSVVAAGAVLRARYVALLVACALAVWAALVLVLDLGASELRTHYGIGLLLATLLAYGVFEVRARSERRLKAVSEDLDAVAAVARCGMAGEDPRPVALAAVCHRAGAATVAWAEPDGDELVVTHSQGRNLRGIRIPVEEDSATAVTFRSAERMLVLDVARDGPPVRSRLLDRSGAKAFLCEPVVHDGTCLAVIAVGWDHALSTLDDHAVRVVSTLAAEAGAAAGAARLRTQLESLATTDPMTGIANRRGWNQRIDALTAHARRASEPLTLVLADLDHFKAYNDTHGHDAGDALLRRMATALRDGLREVDLVARWGGEEFALALPDTDGPSAAVALERLRRILPPGRSCSFGHATWDGVESVQACLARADAALYRAKATGRDRVVGAEDLDAGDLALGRLGAAAPDGEERDAGDLDGDLDGDPV